MPKMAKGDRVRRSELPGTLKRSGSKAQRTFAKTHDAAAEQYGEGERAHRTAFAIRDRVCVATEPADRAIRQRNAKVAMERVIA